MLSPSSIGIQRRPKAIDADLLHGNLSLAPWINLLWFLLGHSAHKSSADVC